MKNVKCSKSKTPAFTKKTLVNMVGLALLTTLACPAHAQRPRVFQAGAALELADLPGTGRLRQEIAGLHSEATKQRAVQWLRSFTFSERDLDHLRSDKGGAIYYADTFLPPAMPESVTEILASPQSPSEQITADDAFSLHSKPGSTKVVYLDFTGHAMTGTAWNSTYATLNALPYDLDGSPTTFSAAELASIASIWRRVAEDFAPFDVDVTTQEPASFGRYTGRLLITRDTDANGNAMPAQGAGGVAYVNVFGMSSYATYYSPALVYFNRLGGGRADYVAEAASHEFGHNLGLSHDGTSGLSYFGGMGSGYVSWGPIMGTGYSRNVSQWSKGDYSDANNTQDDVAIIAGKLPRRDDDHADARAGATALALDASGHFAATTPETDPSNSAPQNKGVIHSMADIDFFTFTTTGGEVVVQALPERESSNTRGGNLDIRLSLYDAAGNLMTSVDPQNETDAALTMTLAAGQYYLSIEGVGNAVTPYTEYGSLGQYFLSGNLPVSALDATPDSFNFMPLAHVDLAAEMESDVVTITGINTAAPITVSGGEYRVNGGGYGSAGASVNNGDAVQVRHTSANASQAVTTTTLTIGEVSAGFSSTTATADTLPNAFSFTAVAGVPMETLQESNAVTISGINAPTAATVAGGEYRVNGGAYGSADGTVRNGDSLQLRHISSSASPGTVATKLTVGGRIATFKSTTWDIKPNTFSFVSQTGVTLSTPVVSNAVTVEGINAASPISVEDGEYSLNGGAFTSAAGTVANGDSVAVRHVSSANFSTSIKSTLVIGGVSRGFVSKTLAKDTTPDAFSFQAQTGVPLSSLVESDRVAVSGINAAAAVSVSGGEYSVNGGAYTQLAGTVNDGDTVQVRQTSSALVNASKTTTLKIGGVAGAFVTTTAP